MTGRSLKRLSLVAALIAMLVLALLGILPLGVRGMFARFTVDAAHAENRDLRDSAARLRDAAAGLVATVDARLQRGRRLAWVIGSESWREPVAAPPSLAAPPALLAAWLATESARLEAVGEALGVIPSGLPCLPAALPTGPPVSLENAVPVASFGWRTSPFTGKREALHGVTLAAPLGSPVLAAGDARVSFAGAVRERRANEWTPFGTIVVLDHDGGVATVYAHLHQAAVRRGQAVKRGDRLGSVGQSGWSRVPGLYFEVRWPLSGVSRPVDPALFLLALPLAEAEARFLEPRGGLPDTYARLETIR